jgi:diamine N-acetyltransferase
VEPTPRLTLVDIDDTNWRAAVAIRVGPEQLRFVADHQPVALVSLAKAFVRPGGRIWKPMAILDHAEMVGLITLAHPVDASECELLHFVIDHACQGRGLGRLALSLVVDHVREALPVCRSIALAVDSDNTIARRLYEPMGFRHTGLERAGDPLYRLELR